MGGLSPIAAVALRCVSELDPIVGETYGQDAATRPRERSGKALIDECKPRLEAQSAMVGDNIPSSRGQYSPH
jgi:hypothetical protein